MNPSAAYIMGQEEPFRSILMHLQAVIKRLIPEAELTYKWKLPFYCVTGRPFCYLHAGKGYVDLCFWHSAHLTVYPEHLVSAGRKVMRSLRYTSLEGLEQKVLEAVIMDAYENRAKGFYGP